MYKFKVGDIVRVILNDSSRSGALYINQTGKIVKCITSVCNYHRYYLLDIDKNKNGIWERELELVEPCIKIIKKYGITAFWETHKI